MARLIAGTALGKAYAEPIEVSGSAQIGERSGIDEWAVCCLKFAGGILAQVSTGVFLAQENVVRIFGSEGDIMIPSPWVPGGREPGVTRIFLRKRGEKQPQELILETKTGLCAMQADAVAKGIPRRQSRAMDWGDTLGNMRTLDLWRKAASIKYPVDLPATNA
jgi:predicted dehydrogenase